MEARLVQSIRRASASQPSSDEQVVRVSLAAEGRSEEGGHCACETAGAPNPFVPADCHIHRGWTSLKPWRTQALKRKPCCIMLHPAGLSKPPSSRPRGATGAGC